MDLKTDTRTLRMVRQLLDNTSATEPIYHWKPQKPAFVPAPIEQAFERVSPESQGVPSETLASYILTLREDETLDMQGLLILRNGKMIADATFGAFSHDVWHITHSEGKSVTGLAIGILIDEGRLSLDDRLVDVLSAYTNKLTAFMHKDVTIRHLLNMTSGASFNEAGSVTEEDWIKSYFESAVLTAPGSAFNYNSMNSYMLSAVIKEVTGEGLVDYLTPRLFEPLGIRNFFWEKCPKGVEKGGWGLYIMPEDIAKIGQMVLSRGVWNGKRIVSEAWIDAATSVQAHPPETLGNYDYGYQIWVGRGENAFLFNGMFGQNVLGFWDSDLLIVSNAGNNELFQQSNFYPLTSAYFGHTTSFSDTKLRKSLGGKLTLEVAKAVAAQDLFEPQPALFGDVFKRKSRVPIDEIAEKLDGKRYVTTDPRASAAGVYPLYAQALQNNFVNGVKSLSFSYRNRELCLIVGENDETHILPLGFSDPAYTELVTHEERHKVGVSARFVIDENGTPVLKVRVSFLETANSRIIKLFFHDDRLVTRWSESPGKTYLTDALQSLKEQLPLVKAAFGVMDEELLLFRIDRVLEPEIVFREA